MKKVLVLGGGIGGTECAVALRKEGFSVTLVSDRPFLYAYPASIWVPTGEVEEEEVKLDLKAFAERWGIELVEGRVSRIKEWEVQLEDGRSFKDFDYAVIAIGQVKKKEEGLEHTLSPCGSRGDSHHKKEAGGADREGRREDSLRLRRKSQGQNLRKGRSPL